MVPLIVADYCFARDNYDKQLATVLACKSEPANILLCLVVDEKGNDEPTITRLAQLIKDSGYMHIVDRSDQELAIRALCNAAAN